MYDSADITKRSASLAALLALELAATVALHRLGSLEWMTIPWSRLGGWLELAPTEDVVAAALRGTALLIAYWVAGSTALYTLAKLSRVPRLIKATAWATLPAVRRVIDRTIAVTVTTAALVSPVAPAFATDAPPTTEPIIYQISDGGVPTPVNAPSVDPTLIVPPGSGGAGYTPNPAGGVEAGVTGSNGTQESVYEVVAGDNLWTISAARLEADRGGDSVQPDEISAYWRRVIELNTPLLSSGDPNLIYPGEQIVLPPIEQGESS